MTDRGKAKNAQNRATSAERIERRTGNVSYFYFYTIRAIQLIGLNEYVIAIYARIYALLSYQTRLCCFLKQHQQQEHTIKSIKNLTNVTEKRRRSRKTCARGNNSFYNSDGSLGFFVSSSRKKIQQSKRKKQVPKPCTITTHGGKHNALSTTRGINSWQAVGSQVCPHHATIYMMINCWLYLLTTRTYYWWQYKK